MHSLRSRLILSHILPLLVVIPLLGVVLIYLLETQVLLTDMSAELLDQAELIAEAVSGQPEIWTDEQEAREFLSRTGVVIDGRVLLIQPTGELIAASELNDDDPLLPPSQEEIRSVLESGQSVVVSYGVFRHAGQALIPVQGVNDRLVGIVGVTMELEGLASSFQVVRWWIIGALLIELILGSLLGYYLAVRLERPIGRSANAVIDISQGKEIDPLPEEGPDEIKSLSRSVNVLDERLRLLEDIRRRSLANIVHEIGRPLGAIRSAVHTLRMGIGEDKLIREELLAGVEDEIERMQPLLNDLAQLHGHVEGNLTLYKQPTDIGDWLPSLLLPWRAAAAEKGLDWKNDIPASLPLVEIDQDRMAQVVGNVLSNAIKYTSAPGVVETSAGAGDLEVWIKVRDTGPGIVAAEQERVFEPFYRSQQQRRFPQGLGVGLTLARDLVHAQGGELTLESSSDDGSVFAIHLPTTSA